MDNRQTPSTTPSSITSSAPRLLRYLNAGSSAHDIAQDPQAVAEARQVLPELKRIAREPAGLEGVKRAIGRRFPQFPQPQRNEWEWSEWWADYVETVGHLPECALNAAMKAWIARPDAEFLPKPGKLKELAESTVSPEIKAYSSAKFAIQLADDEPKYLEHFESNFEQTKPVNREEVMEWVRNFTGNKGLGKKWNPKTQSYDQPSTQKVGK